MTDSFTSELWHGITGIYGAILAHPFVTGLADGSLPHDAFAFYVVQDALYLQRYADALALVASRAPDAAGTEMFARHAAGVIAVEQTLHGTLLASLGIDPATAAAAEPAPTTLAYTSYLLAAINGGSYAEGVGAVLPCYWIYWEVGRELLRRGSPDKRYQRWIDMYGGEELAYLTTHDRQSPQRTQQNKQFCSAFTASAAGVAGAQSGTARTVPVQVLSLSVNKSGPRAAPPDARSSIAR